MPSELEKLKEDIAILRSKMECYERELSTLTRVLYWTGRRMKYILQHTLVYTSPRYGKKITVPAGFQSDGATGAIDIWSDSWWVHDKICDDPHWDDGAPITAWQAATVLHDILEKEGHWARAWYWRLSTFLLGCKAARRNGWW